MPRHTEPDLRHDWKVTMPATLAGSVEFHLMDGLTGRPRYGERSKLIAALLSRWLAIRHNIDVPTEMPSEDVLSLDDLNRILPQVEAQPEGASS